MKIHYGKKNMKFRKVEMIYKMLEYIYKNRMFGHGFKILFTYIQKLGELITIKTVIHELLKEVF